MIHWPDREICKPLASCFHFLGTECSENSTICRLPRCGPHGTLVIHGKNIPLIEVLLGRDTSVHGKLKEPIFGVSTLPWRGLILTTVGSQHYYDYPDPPDTCSRNRERSSSERHKLPRDELLDLQWNGETRGLARKVKIEPHHMILPLEMWGIKVECLAFNKTVISNGISAI